MPLVLNYIWAGLIVFSLLFALTRDLGDLKNDTFRNGRALPVTIKLDGSAKANQPVHVIIDAATYKSFYGVDAAPPSYGATLVTTKKGAELRFAADSTFPAPLAVVKDTHTSDDDKELAAEREAQP
jgi:spore maturation protein A